MPTVEQLYTLIGAKDGFIYDLQLQLSGLNQEHQKVVEERDTLQEKLAMFTTPATEAKPLPQASTLEIASDSDVEVDEFKATFKPH